MWNLILALVLTLPTTGGAAAAVSGSACVSVKSWHQVPPAVRAQLEAASGVGRTADAGEPFNATDLLMGDLPLSRFFAACHEGPDWIIAIERGGRGRHFETFMVRGMQVESKGRSLEPPTVGTSTNSSGDNEDGR
jgi:hypothetical protein